MEKKFDHIEDSIRKAFEGHELPVSDTDWSRIATGLEEAGKKRGFILWWEENRKKILLSAVLFIFLTGTILWWLSNKNQTQGIIDNKDLKTTTQKDQSVERQEPVASGGESRKVGDVTGPESAGNEPSTQTQSPDNGGAMQNAEGLNSINAEQRTQKEIKNPDEGNANPNPIKEDPIVEIKEPIETGGQITPPGATSIGPLPGFLIPDFSFLRTFSVRKAQISSDLLSNILGTVAAMQKTKAPIKPGPKGLEFYAGLQTTYNPGLINGRKTDPVWDGVTWSKRANSSVDLRLDAGIAVGSGDWKFTVGGALEGTAAQFKKRDSVMLIRAIGFLRYITIQKDTFWLANRYDTLYLTSRNNNQQMWAEIPLGFSRTIKANNDLKINIGFTFNPGILIGAKAEMANPYVYRSGSEWDYVYGIKNADTTSLVMSAKQFLNPLRFGNGVQVGIEKDMGTWNWGLNAQTRYYYTPVWKAGVPLRQNTFQYGINLRLGIKI